MTTSTPGAREQEKRREMADVVGSGGGEIEFFGVGFGIGQELGQIIDRQASFDRDHLRTRAHIVTGVRLLSGSKAIFCTAAP